MATEPQVAAIPAIAVNIDDLVQVEAPMFTVSNVQIFGTGNDFVLTFARPRPALMKNREQAQAALAEQVVILQMSPQTCKDLALSLTGAVKNHEDQFGELKTPYTLGLSAK